MSKDPNYDALISQLGVSDVRIKNLTDENTKLLARIDALENFQKDQVRATRNENRTLQLQRLKDKGYEIDIPAELEVFTKLDEVSVDVSNEHFSKKLAQIPKSYARSVVGAPQIETARSFRTVENPEHFSNGGYDDDVTEDDVRTGAIENFVAENPEVCKPLPGETDKSLGIRRVQLFIANKKRARTNGQA